MYIYHKRYFSFVIPLFLICSTVSMQAYGQPCYDRAEIIKHLTLLKLSPTIRINSELLKAVKIQYGKELYDLLISKHPFMSNKQTNKFDLNTLKWLTKMGFHAQKGKGTMYLVSPFGAEVNYGAVSMVEMLTLYNGQAFKNEKILLLKPAFLSESQKKAVHNAFNDSGKYSHAYDAIKDLFTSLSDTEALDIAKGIYSEIFEGRYGYMTHLRFHYIHDRTIAIHGHGYPGTDDIEMKENGTSSTITFEDVIDKLASVNVPKTNNIYLFNCYAASGCESTKSNATEDKLKELLLTGNLKRTLVGDKTKSFAYKFSEKLYKKWPEHKGLVYAYAAAVHPLNVTAYYRYKDSNGKYHLGEENINAVGVKDMNDDKIRFDASELLKVYSRKDFNLPNM